MNKDTRFFGWQKYISKSILFLLFITVSTLSYSQSDLGGIYKYRRTYNSDGDIVKGGSFSKIMVTVVCYYGCTASLSYYNDMVGLWDNNSVTYNYCGYNNGWHMFNFDGGMFVGSNYVYIYEDNSKVRIKFSTDHGKYHEYRKYVRGEDVDTGPTR